MDSVLATQKGTYFGFFLAGRSSDRDALSEKMGTLKLR